MCFKLNKTGYSSTASANKAVEKNVITATKEIVVYKGFVVTKRSKAIRSPFIATLNKLP